MSFFSGILKAIAGAGEIALGALVTVGTLGGGAPLGAMLIGSGAGMVFSGIGTMLAGNGPQKGFATTVRTSIGPWEAIYGEARIGGTVVYDNTWGNNNIMRDLVIVIAAHPCQSIDEVLFDQQRVQIDTTAIPTSALAGYSIATPATGSGTSFTPLNAGSTPYNIASITRSIEGVVTVVLDLDIPLLQSGDQIIIRNITGDLTLNGRFQVSEIVSRVAGVLTFTYLNGGDVSTVDNEGQAVTTWPNYGRNVYFEWLDGTQTLGQTFVGMSAGTPWQGTGKLVTPASPLNAGGTAVQNPWTDYCSLLGKTAVFLRLQYDKTYFPGDLPQISFHVSGNNNIYDPRTSGYGYSTNAALCIADYLANTTWGFNAAYHTDIPDAELTAAANICDESVDLALGGTESRYTCNGKFSLEMRRGEVLQNLLTSCAGRLTYSGGEYVINPGVWVTPLTPNVDLQAIAAGSPKWKPTVSIRDRYNGCKGTYIAPDNLWQSTDFPYYAQDIQHGYGVGDSSLAAFDGDANFAADGVRRWLDIQLPFTISYATAQRLAKIELLRRLHMGTGTFISNMSAYQFVPLDIIAANSSFLGWTGKNLEISAVRLRSEKSGDQGGWILGTELDVQETDSSIYVWSTSEELSPQGYQQSFWPQSTIIETVPFPWSPGYVSPLTGDAYGGPASFGIEPVYGTDASGNGTINLQIKGTAPISNLDQDIEAPQMAVTSTGTGGSLAEGDYMVAVSARSAGSSPYMVTQYQSFGFASVAANGSITISIDWGSGDDGGDVYLAYWTADGYVFHWQQTISSSTTSLTISTFDQTQPGGPDPIFDHFGIVYQQAVHTGPWAEQVQAVTSTTITINTQTGSMSTNQWAGYNLALLAKDSNTVEIPILFMPIASSTASDMSGNFILTIGPNGNGDQLPDLTTLLVEGDLVSVCFNGTFTSTSVSDSNIENAYYPSGATGVEAGHVIVMLTGVDAGDVVTISSVGGGATSFNTTPFAVTPNTGDLFFICQPSNNPEIDTPTISTTMPTSGVMASPPVANLDGAVWLFRVRTENVANAYGPDSLTPWRVVYFFGQPGVAASLSFIIST